MSEQLSRRSVAKGAAWAVPAVSIAGTAPMLAASPTPCPPFDPAQPEANGWEIQCPSQPIRLQDGSNFYFESPTSSSTPFTGLQYTLVGGIWREKIEAELLSVACSTNPGQVELDVVDWDRIIINWGYLYGKGQCGTINIWQPGAPFTVVNGDGVEYDAVMESRSSPQRCSSKRKGLAGFNNTGIMQTTIPYVPGTETEPNSHLSAINGFPLTVEFIQGGLGGTVVKDCQYRVDMPFTYNAAGYMVTEYADWVWNAA